MLQARLRSASGWSDACILNISSGGLLVYSKGVAEPGSHVEIRRGGNLVIARVAWRENQRIGLASEGLVPIDDLISVETANAALPATCGLQVERRKYVRPSSESRSQGRKLEFVTLALVATAMAGVAAGSVEDTLSSPLANVKSALATH